MHPLRLAVGELGTSPGVVRLRLPPLSRAAVEELAAPHDVDAGELYDQTGGNPFYVTEVLAADCTRSRRQCAMPCSLACTAWDRQPRACSRRSPSFRPMSRCGSWTGWCRTRSSTSTPASQPACCATRDARSRSVTSSPGSRSRNRSVLAGAPCSIAACWRLFGSLRRARPDPARLAHHADAAGDSDATLRYATAAGDRAAAQGAHREAVAQYARAVRYAGSLPPAELAGLLERRAQECYFTDHMDDAVAAQERALACHRELGDRRSEGVALVRLSEMLWCPGRLAESERAGLDAVEVLEGLEPGRELALAYANLSTFELALHTDAAVTLGDARHRAGGAARRRRDPAHRPCRHPQARPCERRPRRKARARGAAGRSGSRGIRERGRAHLVRARSRSLHST